MMQGTGSRGFLERLGPIVGFALMVSMLIISLTIYFTPPPVSLRFDTASIELTESGYVLRAVLRSPNQSIYITGVDIGGSTVLAGVWARPGEFVSIPLRVFSPPQSLYIYSFGSRSNEIKPYIEKYSSGLWGVYSVNLNGKGYIAINATSTERYVVIAKGVPDGRACYVVPEKGLARDISSFVPGIDRIDASSSPPVSVLANCTRIAFLDSYPSIDLLSIIRRSWYTPTIYIGFSGTEGVISPYEIYVSNSTLAVRRGSGFDYLFNNISCLRPLAGERLSISGDRELAIARILGSGNLRLAFFQPVASCMSQVRYVFISYASGLPAVVYLSNHVAVIGAGTPVGLGWAALLDLLSDDINLISVFYGTPYRGIAFFGPLPQYKRVGVIVMTQSGDILGAGVSNSVSVEARCSSDICTAAIGVGLPASDSYQLEVYMASYNSSILGLFSRAYGRPPFSIDLPRTEGLYIVRLSGPDNLYQAALGYMEPPRYTYELSPIYEFFTLRVALKEPQASFTKTWMVISGFSVDGMDIPRPPGPSALYIYSGPLVGYIEVPVSHIYEDPRFFLSIAVLAIFTVAVIASMRGRYRRVEKQVTLVIRASPKPMPRTGDDVLLAAINARYGCTDDIEVSSPSPTPEAVAAIYSSIESMVSEKSIEALSAYSESGLVIALSLQNPWGCLLYRLLKRSGELVGIPVERMFRVIDAQGVSFLSLADAAATHGEPPSASINLYFFQRQPGEAGVVEALSRLLSAIYMISSAYPDFNANMGPGRIAALYLVPLPDDYLRASSLLYGLIPIEIADPEEYARESSKVKASIEAMLPPQAVNGASILGIREKAVEMLSHFAIAVAHPLELSSTFTSLHTSREDAKIAIEFSINYHYILYKVYSSKGI